MKGLLIWVGILATLPCFGNNEPLRAALNNVAVLQTETASGLFAPEVRIDGNKFKQPVIRVKKGDKLYMATPLQNGEATLNQVFLSVETGGLYIQENDSTRYLQLSGKFPEPLFIRQMAYLLQQRHAEDESIAKFFKFYFGVEGESSRAAGSVAKLRAPGAGLASVLEDAELSATPPNLEQLFSYMSKPSEWKGLNCTAQRCIYQHSELGTISLVHPGPADLTFQPEELLSPEDEKPVEAQEVKSRNELEKLLASQPESVSKLFVLISHEHCGPCKRLKNVGGLWTELVRKVRKGKLRDLALFAENAKTPEFAPSNLVQEFSLPHGYPQLLIFERTASGSWGQPVRVSADQIESRLKD